MTVTLTSRIVGQSPIGLYTNLWPTTVCRRDRKAMGCWYLTVHVGAWRWEISCQIAG